MKKLRCENSTGSGKYFTGHVCNSIVEVAETSEKVICWACVVRLLGNPIIKNEAPKNIGFPRGWKFMSEFIDKDGNVYHKGVLVPELKDTKKPSKVKPTKKKAKKENQVNFDEIKSLKAKIKAEKDQKKKRKLELKLSTIMKGI
jgi:hypothetical protein